MKRKAAGRAIVACARELWDRRLVTGSSGNLSARLADGSILITPTGRAFRALDARELVRIDPQTGASLEDGKAPSSEYLLHIAAYRARPDIGIVVHTHPTYCVVWSGAGRLFPRDTVASTESLAPMVWVDFFPSGSLQLAEATSAALSGGAPLALLGNHGLIAVGTDFDDALVQTDLAEECARVAYLARAMG